MVDTSCGGRSSSLVDHGAGLIDSRPGGFSRDDTPSCLVDGGDVTLPPDDRSSSTVDPGDASSFSPSGEVQISDFLSGSSSQPILCLRLLLVEDLKELSITLPESLVLGIVLPGLCVILTDFLLNLH